MRLTLFAVCMEATWKKGKIKRESVRKELVELFMCFCDAILTALGHSGENKTFLNSRTCAGNDGFRNTSWPHDRSLVPQ